LYRKFLSLSYVTQKKTPAEVILVGHYKIGKKIANGAFGQLRLVVRGEGVQTSFPLERIRAAISLKWELEPPFS
jgi:hypothetical protein